MTTLDKIPADEREMYHYLGPGDGLKWYLPTPDPEIEQEENKVSPEAEKEITAACVSAGGFSFGQKMF